MKNVTQKLAILVGASVFYIIGQYFRGYWWPNFTWPFPCKEIVSGNISYCDPFYLNSIGWPLIAAGEIFAIVGVMLLFANAAGFRAWRTVSVWFIPVAALFVIFAAPFPLFPVVAPISREHITWFFGCIYIVLSFGALLRGRILEQRNG